MTASSRIMHVSDKKSVLDEVLLDDKLKQKALERLTSFTRRPIDNKNLLHAGVAFVIVDDDRGKRASFLLTRRPMHLKRHGGQYALPGGRIDSGETPAEAALRELWEEVGIRVDKCNVLGLLDDYQTRSGFVITPVVVWAGKVRNLNPDPNEVAETFRIPLADLYSSEIPVLEKSAPEDDPVLSVPLKSLGHQVFAPTAAIVYQFREVVLFDRITRVAQYDQPKFAWE